MSERILGPALEARGGGVLRHPALSPASGAPLASAQLGDRQRVAVVLQAAALLSHLRRAGWRLGGDLGDGWVRDGETLCGLAASPGAPDETRGRLRCLLGALFGPGELAGRGDGRRAARELRARWAGELLRLGPDQAVGEVVAAAPFLWEERFAATRGALLAEWRGGDDEVEVWLACIPRVTHAC